MTIPKQVKIFGMTIEVSPDYDLMNRDDTVGEANHRSNTIRILPSTVTMPRTQEQLEQTYLHELVHFILYYMKKEDLRKDEDFVDSFALAFHQALVTQEGDSSRDLML